MLVFTFPFRLAFALHPSLHSLLAAIASTYHHLHLLYRTYTHTYILYLPSSFASLHSSFVRSFARSFVRSLRSALPCFWTLLVQTPAYTHFHTHMYMLVILFIQYVFHHSLVSLSVGRFNITDSATTTTTPQPPLPALPAFEIPKCTYVRTNVSLYVYLHTYICFVRCDSCCLTTRSVRLAVCKSVARIGGRFFFVSWQTENYSHTKITRKVKYYTGYGSWKSHWSNTLV